MMSIITRLHRSEEVEKVEVSGELLHSGTLNELGQKGQIRHWPVI
jgi:hypothetical protein